MGSLWLPLGDAGGGFGPPLGCLGAPLGSLWMPLGGLGVPCGCFPEILETGDLVSYKVKRIAIRSASLELATGATGAAGAAEMVSKTVARTPHPTRAGGQDDASYTSSLK